MNISEELRQKREFARIGLVMLAIGILFVLYVMESLVHSTKEFHRNHHRIVSVR